MEIACVIPARINSTRFPAKLLHPINHRPVIVHTALRAIQADCFSEIICLTDSTRIRDALAGLNISVKLSEPAHNGTERIAANLDSISSPVILNLQGDEPCFPVYEIQRFAEALKARPDLVHIMVNRIENVMAAANNQNKVKVFLDSENRVLDFNRRPDLDKLEKDKAFNKMGVQMGIYGYSRDFLKRYYSTPPSNREIRESHEMLRILPLPNIQALTSQIFSQSLDVEDDLQKIILQLESDEHSTIVQ